MTIDAVFENGVFRPVQPVSLADRTTVILEYRVTATTNGSAKLNSGGPNAVYAILGERYVSGHSDTAERHNEHQS